MGKMGNFDDAKHALGIHRGPLPPKDSVDGADMEHVETVDSILLEKIERTPTQNLRRHWARFWCCYTLFSIIFLAIFLPIFFLIIIPAVAQNVVNRSDLSLTHAYVLDPKPESIVLTMAASLKLPLSLPVSMNPIALDLFNREQPMNNTIAKVYLPHTIIKGPTTLGVTNTPTLLDSEQWYNFVWKAVHQAHPPLSVRGSTNAFLGELKNHIKLNKDILQTALNGFAGFFVSDTTLLLPPREDGTNLLANATLPNPSVFTLELGNLTCNAFSGDLLLGNVTLSEVVLRPGNHSTPVEGILDISKLLKNIPEVLEDQASALKEGNIELKIIGVSSYYNGIEIPYYSKVLKTLTLNAVVPVGGLLSNTVKGLGSGGDNPLANLSLSKPDEDSGDGGILSKLGGLKNLNKRELDSLADTFSGLV